MKRTYEPREFTNLVLERLKEAGTFVSSNMSESIITALLNYLSDDDVLDFAEIYAIIDPDEIEEE